MLVESTGQPVIDSINASLKLLPSLRAREITKQLSAIQLLTTELVLVETLNYFSGYQPEVWQEVANTVQDLLTEPDIETIWQTQALFLSGLTLYEARLDKGYSLTDCVSMVVMQ